MRVLLRTKNLELTPSLEALVDQKLIKPVEHRIKRLDQQLDIIFDIELARTTKHHTKGKIWRAEAQLTLPYLKKTLRSEAKTESVHASIDEVKYEILRELEKYKDKYL